MHLEVAQRCKDNGRDSIAATVLLANVHFGLSKYAAALQRYCAGSLMLLFCCTDTGVLHCNLLYAATRMPSEGTLAVRLKSGLGWQPATSVSVTFHVPRKHTSECCN